MPVINIFNLDDLDEYPVFRLDTSEECLNSYIALDLRTGHVGVSVGASSLDNDANLVIRFPCENLLSKYEIYEYIVNNTDKFQTVLDEFEVIQEGERLIGRLIEGHENSLKIEDLIEDIYAFLLPDSVVSHIDEVPIYSFLPLEDTIYSEIDEYLSKQKTTYNIDRNAIYSGVMLHLLSEFWRDNTLSLYEAKAVLKSFDNELFAWREHRVEVEALIKKLEN